MKLFMDLSEFIAVMQHIISQDHMGFHTDPLQTLDDLSRLTERSNIFLIMDVRSEGICTKAV